MVDRGRVWKNCVPQRVDPAIGLSVVAVEFPDPHRIQDKSIIYVFEEGEAGRYLGEFKVEAVAEKQVTLTPTMKLSPRQLDKIKGSARPGCCTSECRSTGTTCSPAMINNNWRP